MAAQLSMIRWVRSARVEAHFDSVFDMAIAGPIGFIGLIVPHIVRFWAGADYRWILPYSALAGAILLLLADIGARLIIQPQELPVGIVMPLLGAPFFIYLTRFKVRR